MQDGTAIPGSFSARVISRLIFLGVTLCRDAVHALATPSVRPDLIPTPRLLGEYEITCGLTKPFAASCDCTVSGGAHVPSGSDILNAWQPMVPTGCGFPAFQTTPVFWLRRFEFGRTFSGADARPNDTARHEDDGSPVPETP